jgi:hypothetical protein
MRAIPQSLFGTPKSTPDPTSGTVETTAEDIARGPTPDPPPGLRPLDLTIDRNIRVLLVVDGYFNLGNQDVEIEASPFRG